MRTSSYRCALSIKYVCENAHENCVIFSPKKEEEETRSKKRFKLCKWPTFPANLWLIYERGECVLAVPGRARRSSLFASSVAHFLSPFPFSLLFFLERVAFAEGRRGKRVSVGRNPWRMSSLANNRKTGQRQVFPNGERKWEKLARIFSCSRISSWIQIESRRVLTIAWN